jgi:hypothetical protein
MSVPTSRTSPPGPADQDVVAAKAHEVVGAGRSNERVSASPYDNLRESTANPL